MTCHIDVLLHTDVAMCQMAFFCGGHRWKSFKVTHYYFIKWKINEDKLAYLFYNVYNIVLRKNDFLKETANFEE